MLSERKCIKIPFTCLVVDFLYFCNEKNEVTYVSHVVLLLDPASRGNAPPTQHTRVRILAMFSKGSSLGQT